MRLSNGIGFDNTGSIKSKCDSGEYSIPGIKRGNEVCRFNVGDLAVTSGKGNIIKGLEVKVLDKWNQNGYWYYSVQLGKSISVQRDKDLM